MQRIPRGRDPILSTEYTNFSGGRGFPLGGDVEEIGHFQSGQYTFTWYIFFASPPGGDVKKMGDFQVGKYVHMVSFFWHHLLGAMLRKLAVFKKGKYVPFFGKKITTE